MTRSSVPARRRILALSLALYRRGVDRREVES